MLIFHTFTMKTQNFKCYINVFIKKAEIITTEIHRVRRCCSHDIDSSRELRALSWCRRHRIRYNRTPPHKPIFLLFSPFFCPFVPYCFTLFVFSTPSRSRADVLLLSLNSRNNYKLKFSHVLAFLSFRFFVAI